MTNLKKGIRLMMDINTARLIEWRKEALEEVLQNARFSAKERLEYEHKIKELNFLLSKKEDFKNIIFKEKEIINV